MVNFSFLKVFGAQPIEGRGNCLLDPMVTTTTYDPASLPYLDPPDTLSLGNIRVVRSTEAEYRLRYTDHLFDFLAYSSIFHVNMLTQSLVVLACRTLSRTSLSSSDSRHQSFSFTSLDLFVFPSPQYERLVRTMYMMRSLFVCALVIVTLCALVAAFIGAVDASTLNRYKGSRY